MSTTIAATYSSSMVSRERPWYYYQFLPNYSIITNTGQRVDLSNLEVNLYHLLTGGIGYGGGAQKLLAQGMKSIGSGNGVCNLPFCISGRPGYGKEYEKLTIFSEKDKEIQPAELKNHIEEAISRSFTQINIPIDIDGHVSLLSIVVSDGKGTLIFYDSLAPTIISYESRYTKHQLLLNYIRSCSPVELGEVRIFHLHDQGDEKSNGCGYFTLYTAYLLKEQRNVSLTFEDDARIRAELAVLTLIEFGPDNVDTSPFSMCMSRRDGIFNRLEGSLPELVSDLKLRLKAF